MKPVLACVLLLTCACAAQKDKAASIFPLAKGTTWVYDAHLKYTVPDTSPAIVREQDLRWRMEIVETIMGRGFDAALIKGAPWDLAWYEPGKTDRGDYLIVTAGNSTYQMSDDEALKTYKTLKNFGMTQEVRKILNENHVWFRGPLGENATYCNADQSEQPSGMYCWHVDDVRTVKLARILGPEKSDRTAYFMAYRTNPEHEILTLVPGIGITAWEYAHHGTVSEADLRLVEFHRGQ